MRDGPLVSVVMPVHNAERTLRACLSSVFQNRDVPYEVIVVDDASTDGSSEIALGFPCVVLSLERGMMAANCRNLGARHARGEILLFFDSDQLMPPDAIGALARTLQEQPEIDAVVASLGPDTPESGFFSQFKNYRHYFVHQMANADGSTLASGLTAIRKSVFERYGGFEPAYGPSSVEDIALGYRLFRDGRRILFRPDVQVVHLKGYTLWSLVVSDIRDRAIPWTALLLRDRMWRDDLNISRANRASVALSGAILPTLAGLRGWWRLAAPGSCIVAIGLLNRDLVRAGAGRFGVPFALKTLAFLPVMYFCQGVGFVAGVLAHATGRGIHGVAAPSEVPYRVLGAPVEESEPRSTAPV